MSIRLLCTLTSNIGVIGNTLNATIDDTTKRFSLQPEEGKKTSFVLNHQNTTTSTKNAATETAKETTNSISILKPCHLLLECILSTSSFSSSIDRDPNSKKQSWLFGGLEIQSNSRNIEVYATESDEQQQQEEPTKTESTTLKETYWQTCRGQQIIKDHDENEYHNDDDHTSISQLIHNDNIDNTNAIPTYNLHHSTPATTAKEEWYKTIILPPSSKPTSIRQLHLKLLSIRPSTCNNVFIRILKVKGRMPEVELEVIHQLPAQVHQPEIKDHQSQVQSFQMPSTTTNDQNKIPSTTSNQDEQMIAKYMMNMNLKDSITPTSFPHNQTTTNQYTSSINQDIAKAISGLTMLIQNINTTLSTSLSSSVGEMQKMVFDQYNTTHLQITSMEQSVQALKYSVDQLTSQVIHLQQEQQLQQKQQLQQQLEDVKCQIIQEFKEQQNQRLHPTDIITKNNENQNQYLQDVIAASVKEQLENLFKMKTIDERDALLQHELQIKAHIQQEREKLLNEVNTIVTSSLKGDCKCHMKNDENVERKIETSTNDCDEE